MTALEINSDFETQTPSNFIHKYKDENFYCSLLGLEINLFMSDAISLVVFGLNC